MLNVTELVASDLQARYSSTRALTDALAAPLSPEDQTAQSMPDASPTKWHRGHTSWFFETFLLPALPAYRPYHPLFGYLFNSYYETIGPRYPRPQRGLVTRPGIGEIASYRAQVDEAMSELLADRTEPRTAFLAELGIQHEQQHQELLLMDIKSLLVLNPLRPRYHHEILDGPHPNPALNWVEIAGGTGLVGHDGTGFAFDNEEPRHRVVLGPYAIADRPVSCGDWLGFMADRGYERPELWLSDGWSTVQREGWQAPLYWEQDGTEWAVFTLGGLKTARPRRTSVPRQLLRGGRVRSLGRGPAAHRGRMGTRGERDRPGPLFRPRPRPPAPHGRGGHRSRRTGMGMDGIGVPAVPRVPALR